MTPLRRPRFDHVGYAARELAPVERALREGYGLGVERFPVGGGHVPLGGGQYVEIHTAALPTALGEWIERITRRGNRWYGWSVEVDDVGAIAAQRGLTPQRFGVEEDTAFTDWSGWHVGSEMVAASRGLLPYFLSYDNTADEMAAIFAEKHRIAAHDRDVGVARITVGGSADALHEWIGADLEGVTVDPSGTGVMAVEIELEGEYTALTLDA